MRLQHRCYEISCERLLSRREIPFWSVVEAPYADQNTPQLPHSLPLSHCCFSALQAQLRALYALSRNKSVPPPCQKASWLSMKVSLLLARNKALAPLHFGQSRSCFRPLSREVCVGDAGFVFSHTLTFCFMWAYFIAAAEVVHPLNSTRKWNVCQIWSTGRFTGVFQAVCVWSSHKINAFSAMRKEQRMDWWFDIFLLHFLFFSMYPADTVVSKAQTR